MKTSLRTKFIYASLPLALVWTAYNFGWDNTKVPVVNRSTPVIQTVPKATGTVDARLIDIEKESLESWGADPFRTVVRRGQTRQAERKIQWFLSGIIYSKEHPLAFINKQSVRIGDIVDQARVVMIERKSVTIDYKGQRLTLAVKKG